MFAFSGGEAVGVNPKINNMLPAYKNAKFDLLWICDSSILSKSIEAMPSVLCVCVCVCTHVCSSVCVCRVCVCVCVCVCVSCVCCECVLGVCVSACMVECVYCHLLQVLHIVASILIYTHTE